MQQAKFQIDSLNIHFAGIAKMSPYFWTKVYINIQKHKT